MDILKRISDAAKDSTGFNGEVEEAVFVFNGVLGEHLIRQPRVAGCAVKVLAAFSEKPVQSNYYEVFEQEKMSNLIPRLAVKTAIMCVPHKQAAYIARQLVKDGITRVWNWSGIELENEDAAILNETPPCAVPQEI